MEILNNIVKIIPLANLENYLDNLKLGYKDKVAILLGETGAGKSTFINSITQKEECLVSARSTSCTQEVKFVKLFLSGYNYYFIDTPGLNDAKGDEQHKKLLKKISQKGILTTIILVQNYNFVRLSQSNMKTLEAFMNIFPSRNFWEHVLLIESFYFSEIKKDPLAKSIIDNETLKKYMEDNNIIIPKEIKTFKLNLIEKYEKNKDIFNNILENIKEMHPFYKSYHEDDEFKIWEAKNLYGTNILNYKHIKHIEYTNFNDQKFKNTIIIDRGEYPMVDVKPEQIIIERENTDEYRNKSWDFFGFCPPEYHVYYYEIKLYNFKGNIYKYKAFKNDTWETDDKEGEKYRRELESKANRGQGCLE